MAWEDLRDSLDTYMASLVGGAYSGWSGRTSIKSTLWTSIARAVTDEFGGGSVVINETPDLPDTTFASTPADQYVEDDTSGRSWSSWWDNVIGTLTITSGVFTHVPNLSQDQQMLTTFDRSPRLWTTLPQAKKITLEATTTQQGVHTQTLGIVMTGLCIYGLDVVTGNRSYVLFRLTKSVGPILQIRSLLNINGSDRYFGTDSLTSSYFTTGTDMRLVLEGGYAATSYRLTGSGDAYSTETKVALGRLAPMKAMVFLGHTTGLTGSVTLTIQPTLLKVEN